MFLDAVCINKKVTYKNLIVILLIILLLPCLFFISYSYTEANIKVNNTPRDAITSYCDSINSKEHDKGMLSEYSGLEVSPSNIYPIVKGEDSSSYSVTFSVKKTLHSGELVSYNKTIPIRLHKDGTMWIIENTSINNFL